MIWNHSTIFTFCDFALPQGHVSPGDTSSLRGGVGGGGGFVREGRINSSLCHVCFPRNCSNFCLNQWWINVCWRFLWLLKVRVIWTVTLEKVPSHMCAQRKQHQGPVVQRVVSLTSSLRVISLTVLADSIHNILIFFAEKMWVAFALQKLLTFFQQKISAYLRITRCKF